MDVQPFMGRVAVAELPNDAAKSSIIIQGSVGPQKGVVQSVSDDVPHLEPGMVVYYCDHDHPKIGDVTIINAECVVAFER